MQIKPKKTAQANQAISTITNFNKPAPELDKHGLWPDGHVLSLKGGKTTETTFKHCSSLSGCASLYLMMYKKRGKKHTRKETKCQENDMKLIERRINLLMEQVTSNSKDKAQT